MTDYGAPSGAHNSTRSGELNVLLASLTTGGRGRASFWQGGGLGAYGVPAPAGGRAGRTAAGGTIESRAFRSLAGGAARHARGRQKSHCARQMPTCGQCGTARRPLSGGPMGELLGPACEGGDEAATRARGQGAARRAARGRRAARARPSLRHLEALWAPR